MDPLFLGLRHVALNVRNVQRSIQFYSRVLGMKLEWMPDEQNAYLTSGQDNLALHQLPEGSEPGSVQLVHHIGFIVKRPENVDAWADQIRKQGIELAQEPKTHRDGARSLYFNDPDGLLIQLIYHPPISDCGELATGSKSATD
jgi:catechol 2,3-dioxygenase-like lactoylglutathione lyase family enzyme